MIIQLSTVSEGFQVYRVVCLLLTLVKEPCQPCFLFSFVEMRKLKLRREERFALRRIAPHGSLLQGEQPSKTR